MPCADHVSLHFPVPLAWPPLWPLQSAPELWTTFGGPQTWHTRPYLVRARCTCRLAVLPPAHERLRPLALDAIHHPTPTPPTHHHHHESRAHNLCIHPRPAEYGLSSSIGPLSVGTLISGGNDYSLLKDSGSPVARWVEVA